MGCNYYVSETCPHCGHVQEFHIGKSSAGWVFSLHVIPEKSINSLADWKSFLKGKTIYDEYGDPVEYQKMIEIITERGGDLLRHDNEFCIGHGEGTYDYLIGEFY